MEDVTGQAAALRRLSGLLDDTARRLAGLPAGLAAAWSDPAGREWSDRLELVRREAVRRASEAADLAGDLTADPAADPVPDTAAHPAAEPDPADRTAGGAVPGLRAGGATGARVTDRRGVVAPLLPPHGGTGASD